VASDAVFEEYRRVAWRLKREQRLPGDPEPLLRLIRSHALWVVTQPLRRPVCRDPKDDKFLETALAARAQTVVTRDADLTDLEKPFGIEILTPRQFLASLPRQSRRRLD
jgi:putative PIN family toxin of toxin-antitoxin system